jgi:hypothetical protein
MSKFIWTSALLKDDDKLFRSDCGDGGNNAILNYGESDRFAIYHLGYQDAAELLTLSYLENDRPKDRLVYPIIFLYRQHIELKLKEFIYGLNYCLDKNFEFPKHHDLLELWIEFISLFSLVEPKNVSKKSFSDAESIIKEFSEYDPNSMNYRYPLDKRGNISKKPNRLNVRNFAYIMVKLNKFLNALSNKIDDYKSIASLKFKDGIYEWES